METEDDMTGMDEDIREQNSEISDQEIEEKVSNCVALSQNQKVKLKLLLTKHRKVFDKKPGKINVYYHKLVIDENQYKFKRPYPVPIAYRTKVREEVERMLGLGIISPSTSPYVNPLVTVIKKDGSIRLCMDARELNNSMQDDHESPQDQEDIFHKCRGAKYMSTLDLTSSFWQIPLHRESKKYTAFIYEGRTYEHNVTPFGLKTSSASLLRALSIILRNVSEFTCNFIDDLLCISKSFEEHLEHLNRLLECLSQNGMTINFKKTAFFREEVEFLGHILTPEGIKPQEKKIRMIKDFQEPKNQKHLRGFLGFINYYAKFVRQYADEIKPLLKLLKKDTKWLWGDEEKRTFNRIKQCFTNDMFIYHIDPSKELILTTDASEYAIGGGTDAVQYQRRRGNCKYGEQDIERT